MRLLPIATIAMFAAQPGDFSCSDSEPVENAGPDLYATYCVECHGADGRGGGPRAASLARKPADLTHLGEEYGMPLPREELAAWVDGRAANHPGREMPVFGEKFFAGQPESMDRETAKRVAIDLILSHVESLQQPE